MDIRVRSSRRVAVVDLAGELTRANLVEAESTINAVVEAGCNTVILGLEKATSLPSVGLHFLLDTHDRLLGGGAGNGDKYGKLILANLSKEQALLIEALRMEEAFNISLTSRTALNREGVDERTLQEGVPGAKPFIIRRPDGTEEERRLGGTVAEDDLKKVVRVCLPGKLAFGIVEYFHQPGQNIARLRDVAAAINQPVDSVTAMTKTLAKRAIFKPMGADNYNFCPKPDLAARINQFFELYSHPEHHARLLGMVLEAEEK